MGHPAIANAIIAEVRQPRLLVMIWEASRLLLSFRVVRKRYQRFSSSPTPAMLSLQMHSTSGLVKCCHITGPTKILILANDHVDPISQCLSTCCNHPYKNDCFFPSISLWAYSVLLPRGGLSPRVQSLLLLREGLIQ